jgi:ABC-type nitrate/sulfonate/bicarbonate transport system substrate-binding protein
LAAAPLMVRQLAVRALAIAALLLGCAPLALAQTPAPATIRFIAAPGDDLLGFWYAQSAGLFEKAGLNIVVEKASSGAAVTPAIVGGAADIGRTSINSLIAAHVRNIPFVLIAPASIHQKQKSVNSGVLVAAGAPFKSVLDLQGKTISSTELGSIGSIGLRALIDEQGGDSSTLHWVELPAGAIGPALQQGRIDAGISSEPAMTRDLATGKVRVLADMLDGYPGVTLEGAFFAMSDWAAANQDAVARFVRVLRQANGYANTHTSELLPLLIANTGLEPEVAAKMHHALIGTTFDASQVQPIVDLVAKYKIIPHGFDAHEMFAAAPK